MTSTPAPQDNPFLALMRRYRDDPVRFAEEVMPAFHGEEAAHAQWKAAVLKGDIVLEDLDTQGYDIYSHQNEDIVRLTPEQLKAQMAAKETAQAAGDD